MKRFFKLAIVFAAGVVVGLIPSVLIWFNRESLWSNWNCLGLADMSLNALQIKQNKSQEVLRRYEQAIPISIVVVNSEFRKDPMATNALWAAQRFYEEEPSSPLPEDAKQVLASLPPRPPTHGPNLPRGR